MYVKSPFMYVKSPFIYVKSPFMYVKSPFKDLPLYFMLFTGFILQVQQKSL